jgi:tetratricopeptide (TPR) repeat protein
MRTLHALRNSLASLAALAAFACFAQEARELTTQARALVDGKDPQGAFALLERHEERLGGDIEFDYWLGVAALETSRLDRAVIAFERVLVRDPLFDSARLELGRTYLRMGAIDLAAQEFERLLPRAPSPAGRKAVEDYLAEIERLRERRRFAASAFVEIGAGRDTNLSSSTRDFPNAILSSFGLPGILPTGNSIRRADNFLAANAGGDLLRQFGDERALFGAASVRWRGYREFSEYDYVLADFIGGGRLRAAGIEYSAAILLQAFRQDGAVVDALGAERITNDRDAAGLNLEVRRDLDGATQVAVGLQYTAYRYRNNPGQDTRQTAMSIAFDHRPAWLPLGTTVGLRAFYGHDEARRPLNPFTETTAARHTFGARLIAQTDPAERLSWVKAFGWSRRIDDDPFARATLVATGRDDLFEAFVRASYRITPSLSAQAYGAYVYNKANIDLYTFRKAEGGLVLRYDLKW